MHKPRAASDRADRRDRHRAAGRGPWHLRAGDAGARMAHGLRLLPWSVLVPMWGLWVTALVGFDTAPAWSGHVPGAPAAYRLLDRWPGVLAAFSAAVCASIDAEGDPPGLLHTLPAAGPRLWLDRVALAVGCWVAAAGTGLAAARVYLPLPWGPALGTLVPPSALLCGIGFCAGALWGAWLGEGAALAVWIFAATDEMLGRGVWRFDPFLATQGPAGARLLANRWALGAAAATLGVLSVAARRHPDRWGAWLRLLRPRLPGGVRASMAGVLAAALVAATALWSGVRPALWRPPARPLIAAGAVGVAGSADVRVTESRGLYRALVEVPVTVPPLQTSLLFVAAGPVLSVRDGAVALLREIPPPGLAGQPFAGRVLGWAGSRRPVTLRLRISLPPPEPSAPPASWPGLSIGGTPLRGVRLVWPAGAPLRPAGAVACGRALCWNGSVGRLRWIAAGAV